ncbi:glutamate 5-kinase [Lachancea thermotolerans CBS 6340]|uniref:KLTH0G06006p n=1 Tax=Lachancea thermotolerans (strain ATCC 56472 / CBS 6340 / NRRL Y-8284) TaxID=559295 RepID=C5DM50_LACTC|nr:KLTH0G06006p [Lachancea thermotolerans CBS 6340]CAR24861.1 KLTH0G06006p [Lachancea thermotolerans CBS 6340]
MSTSYTIVIKLGSSSLVDEKTKEPKLSTMAMVVETVVRLRRNGHRVVLVSSGGIAVGLKTLNLERRPKHLAQVQAIAAVGQGRLIGRWDALFSQFSQRIAQILITRNDIVDWTQYKNAQNTIHELLQMGVVPIVNENDTLSVSEIKFGDNDTLSAITAALCGADYLFLLTDVDCLYTDNPRTNPEAKPILVVPATSQVSEGTLGVKTSSGSGSDVGTGGMTTKLIAAELATNAGVNTIIMKSTEPSNISKVVSYMQSRESATTSANGDIEELQKLELLSLQEGDVPLHTRFVADKKQMHLKNREFWMLHGLVSKGAIIIDRGAHAALTRKNKAGLLPAGVIEVEGNFHEHECIDLKVGARLENGELDPACELETIGRARCNYTSLEISKIKGLQSDQIENVLGYADSEYVAHRENLAFPPH